MSAGAVILLDIDGVVNRLASAEPGYEPRRLSVDAAIVRRVQRLSRTAEVVWASTWDAETRASLAATIGLPPGTRSITDFTVPPDEQPRATRKLHGVARWLQLHEPEDGWRAVAWIDDVLFEDAARWTLEVPYPMLLVRTDPIRGLGDPEVERVEAFLAAPPA